MPVVVEHGRELPAFLEASSVASVRKPEDLRRILQEKGAVELAVGERVTFELGGGRMVSVGHTGGRHEQLVKTEASPLKPGERVGIVEGVEASVVEGADGGRRLFLSARKDFAVAAGQDIERSLLGGVQERVASEEELTQMLGKMGFSGMRGTFESRDRSVYVYVKRQHASDTLEQAQNDLKVARYLTSAGMVNPNTEWGIIKTQDGRYSLYSCTRALEDYDTLGRQRDGGQTLLTKEMISQGVGHKVDEVEYITALIERKDSHVKDWIGRLEARGHRFDPKSRGNSDEIFRLLNVLEARHQHNWGWDKGTGVLYPLDMEVINFEGAEAKAVVNRVAGRIQGA